MIASAAAVCRFCGEAFDPALKKRKRRRASVGAEDEDLTGVDILLAILCTNIGCILGLIWVIQGKPKGAKMLGLCVLIQVIAFFVGFILSAMGGGPPP
jgi:hypothetical protein